jgi:predicted hydrolase (HD superfamily)
MEWSLYCCDELTGFIVAVALVRPEKKLAPVELKSVLKRFPQKAFAAGVHREQIQMCEEKLGIKLDEFVLIVLTAMKENASEIGM